MAMTFDPTPEQMAFIQSLIDSGRYPNAMAVLEAAMALLDEHYPPDKEKPVEEGE